MFRTQTHRTLSFVTLASLAVLLSFAAGCTNSVVGPERQSSSVSTSMPRLPIPAPMPRPPVEIGGPEKSALPTTQPIPGDLTGDGQVDSSDLAAFAFLMRADVTQDQVIDNKDASVYKAILGGTVPDLAAPFGTIDSSDFAAYAAAKSRADLNTDGYVDSSDLAFFAWMRARGDLNHDGIVSRHDRQLILPELTP